MFTRYSGIDIPNNYSGNRFKKTIIEDTTMKIHENEIINDIKTSVSPSYNQWLYSNNNFIENSTNENHDDDLEISKEEKSYENDKNQTLLNNTSEKNLLNEEDNIIDQIKNYLKNIKTDDLILILLIIFLASDKNSNNNDMILILAILLTF